VKIALCVPCYDKPAALFMQCLGRMIIGTLKERPDLELDIFLQHGVTISAARNRLVAAALDWEADFILWMDSDHVFPVSTLLRLLAWDKDIVGCNYARRDRTGPAANSPSGVERVFTTAEKARDGQLERVSRMGMGLCLVGTKVFRAIPVTWFAEITMADGRFLGEDYSFFTLAANAGFPAWCDHALSWEVGHVHETLLWNRDVLPDSPAAPGDAETQDTPAKSL
jgi:hypothetical protein